MFRRKDESGELQLDADVLVEEEVTALTTPAAVAVSAPVPASRPAMPMAASTPAARPASPMAAQPYRPLASQAGSGMSSHVASSSASQSHASSDFRPMPASPMASSTSANNPSKTAGKRVLTVGNDILLRGEIATCDRLVIEGAVDATLKDVHTVEIAEHGSFKGTAEIEDAEISGLFEGDLIVRNRLTIYSTGKVRGRIAYGEIEIERGGELSGEITFGRPEAVARGKRTAA